METLAPQQTAKVFRLKTSHEALRRSETCPAYSASTNELVIYTDNKLDADAGERLFLRLVAAFPKMTETTATLIIERMADNGFSRNRAIDAVHHVIDTYDGWDKVPNIANFIQFDRRIKLLTYAEITSGTNQGALSWDDYQPVDVGLDKPRWARIEDVRKHQIKQWQQP